MDRQTIINKILEIDKTEKPVGRYDLLPLFQYNDIFSEIVNILSKPYFDKIDYVISPEAIGWILGSSIARKLKTGFIPIRKGNKLPYSKEKLFTYNYEEYSNVEKIYKQKSIEIKKDLIENNSKILIVDEWIESGSTVNACMKLLEKMNCKIIGIATIGVDENENTKEWIENDFITYVGKNI